MRTTVKHMQGNASSVILRPNRRITMDVPSSEKPNEIVFVTCTRIAPGKKKEAKLNL